MSIIYPLFHLKSVVSCYINIGHEWYFFGGEGGVIFSGTSRLCFKRLKVWWQYATLFVYFYIFFNIHTVQSSNHIHTIHSPRPLSISSSLVAQWERPPCGAEPGIELGPAFQQADALPTEPRHASLLWSLSFSLPLCRANRNWRAEMGTRHLCAKW